MRPDWMESFKLDADDGPAPPLGAAESDAVASKIVERAFATSAMGASVSRFRALLVVAGVVSAVGATSVAFHESRSGGPSSAPVATLVAPVDAPPVAMPPSPIESVPVTALPNAPAEASPSGRPPPKAVERFAKPEAASDLLAEANRSRGNREWARAAGLYERVMSSQAEESYAATVALASLRLEHFDDPRGALVLYERALADRPSGPLSAQAELGAARCRRALAEQPREAP